MAKKQTRRSISVSRTTYERLKAFCESNNISMSQLVETRVNDFLGPNDLPAGASTAMPMTTAPRPLPPRPAMPSGLPARALDPRPSAAPNVPHAPQGAPVAHGASSAPQTSHTSHNSSASQAPSPASQQVPMTSAAARFAVEPPPPIIKPRQDTAAPKPAEKRPEQIFTF